MSERERAAELWRASLYYVLSRRPDVDVERLARIAEEEGGSAEEVRTMARALSDIGEWRGGRRILRDVLEERFGSISENLTRRIEAIEDSDSLRQLTRRAVRIDSPDQLFEPPPAA